MLSKVSVDVFVYVYMCITLQKYYMLSKMEAGKIKYE